MRRRTAGVVAAAGVTLLLVGAGIGVARDRLQERPAEQVLTDAEIAERKNTPNFVNPEPAPTPEELERLATAIQREQAIASVRSPHALFDAAERSQAPIDAPPGLASALEAGPQGDAAGILADLLVVFSKSENVGGLDFETVFYSDGDKSVQIRWQEWPQNVDPSILVHEDATVENLSSYDLVTRHYPNEELVYIVIYDGVIVVDLSTDTNMSVSDAQELATKIYLGLVAERAD